MDEYNRDFDPHIRQYFNKIMKSVFVIFLWFFYISIAGMYLGLGEIEGTVRWYNILFYLLAVISFLWMLRYYYRLWKN